MNSPLGAKSARSALKDDIHAPALVLCAQAVLEQDDRRWLWTLENLARRGTRAFAAGQLGRRMRPSSG